MRPDALFVDPTAGPMVAAAAARLDSDDPIAWVRGTTVLGELLPAMTGYLAVRTRLFDRALVEASRAGCRQVVQLGAGLDGRALRIPWPVDVRVFDLDDGGTTEFKQTVLGALDRRPLSRHIMLASDLRGPWRSALLDAGFEPSVPTVWSMEGLLVYLDEDVGTSVVETAADLSAPGSRLIVEHGYPAATTAGATSAGRAALAARGTRLGAAVAEPVTWLRRLGWNGTVLDVPAAARACGRRVPPAVDAAQPDGPLFWIATARRAL